MKQFLKKTNIILLQKLLFAVLIFSIPTNLFKIFLSDSAYVNGLRVDYLIPKLHLNDILVVLFLFSLALIKQNRQTILDYWKNLDHKNLITALAGILFIFQLSTPHYIIGILFFIRVITLIKLGIILKANKQIITSKITTTAVSITLVFQSLLAWFQYLQQESFAGYYFFGETQLNSYAGIAKSSLFGLQQIIPYGTTAHPNILGGVIAIFTLIHLNTNIKNLKYKRANLFIYLLGLSAIILTQSVSAILAITIGTFVILFKSKITFKLLIIIFLISNLGAIGFLSSSMFSDKNRLANFAPTTFLIKKDRIQKNSSISRRAYLNEAAISMSANNIFTGIGLHNFTSGVEQYSTNKEVVRFVQPAHNILLLILSETGLLGIILITLTLMPQLRKIKTIKHPEYLLALIPIMIWDHYLVTLQSGIILLFLSLTITD